MPTSTLGFGEDGELLDLVDLTAVTGATLGTRPIPVTGTDAEIVDQLAEILPAYRSIFDGVAEPNRIATLAEDDPGLTHALRDRCADHLAEDLDARFGWQSMLQIKGLERPVVIWSTRSELSVDEAQLEWIYTILPGPRVCSSWCSSMTIRCPRPADGPCDCCVRTG